MRPVLISFDLRADFGVFKKPDVNDGLQVTFNLLHKPALLGILGAIAGLEGYQQRGKFPAYYEALHNLKIGIEPLGHDKGNFTKTVIKYTNTVGYANADGNLIVTEQTLCRPAYRCYLLLDLDDELQAHLHDRIVAGEAEYLPYFGKNECSAWWEAESVQSYVFEPFQAEANFRIDSIFIRKHTISSQKVEPEFSFAQMNMQNAANFIYFERLPVQFFVGDKREVLSNDTHLVSAVKLPDSKRIKPLSFVQYDLAEFVFTDWVLKQSAFIEDLYRLEAKSNKSKVIQLF